MESLECWKVGWWGKLCEKCDVAFIFYAQPIEMIWSTSWGGIIAGNLNREIPRMPLYISMGSRDDGMEGGNHTGLYEGATYVWFYFFFFYLFFSFHRCTM